MGSRPSKLQSGPPEPHHSDDPGGARAFRAYHRAVLATVEFEANSDAFGFDAQFLAQAIKHGFTVADAPMPVKYFKEASSIGSRPSVRYGIDSLKAAAMFTLSRVGIRFRLFVPRAKDATPAADAARPVA